MGAVFACQGILSRISIKVTKKEAVSSGSDIVLNRCDRISFKIEDNFLSAKARKIFLQTGISKQPKRLSYASYKSDPNQRGLPGMIRDEKKVDCKIGSGEFNGSRERKGNPGSKIGGISQSSSGAGLRRHDADRGIYLRLSVNRAARFCETKDPVYSGQTCPRIKISQTLSAFFPQ
jgi:hypothetical protein